MPTPRQQIDGWRHADHAQEVGYVIISGQHRRQHQHAPAREAADDRLAAFASATTPSPRQARKRTLHTGSASACQGSCAARKGPRGNQRPIDDPTHFPGRRPAKELATDKPEDQDLKVAAHEKVVGMQSKVNENRRGYQTRRAHKEAYPRQFSPHSFFAGAERGNRKLMPKRRNSNGVNAPACRCREAARRIRPPARCPRFRSLHPLQSSARHRHSSSGRKFPLNAVRPKNRLRNRNCQQPCSNAADQQAAPRGGPPASFVSAKKQLPQPEDDKDRAGAGKGRGQAQSQHCPPQKGSGQGNTIDNHPFASIICREKSSVLSLQHLQCIDAMGTTIIIKPRGDFAQTIETQRHDDQRQCDQDPPRYQSEVGAFAFSCTSRAGRMLR